MRDIKTQRKYRWLSICIVFAMLVGLSNGQGYLTFAYEEQSAMIRPAGGDMVETKTEPLDDATKRNGLVYGKPVTVVEEVTDANGVLWYKLTYNLKAGGTSWGYCHAEDVLLDKDISVYAYGIINASEVSIRDDAGTDRTNILIQVDAGTEVEMLDETTVNGKTWYRVRYTAPDTVDAATGGTIPGKVYIGWTYGDYVTLDRYNVEVDSAYVEELIAKGFPASYAQKLGILHALYPEWVFEPVLTGLKWQDVINGETLKADGSSRPINMVENSYDDSMKSTHPDDYNWETNTWTIYDGNRWVAVHPDYLAHVMDPRNFLTETYIFQFESLSYSELHTIEGVNAVIGSSFMANDAVDSDGSMFNYATAFMSIGKEVGVSPYHLVSRVRQEQGSKGTSDLISGTYSGFEGYYNYFNFGASGVTDKAVIENGLTYAKNQGWDTRYKSLKGGAERIAKNYIARGQDTLYFQKFNVVWKDSLYGHQYMGAVLAPSSEAKSIAKAYTDKHQAFVFRIPVYEEMPEEAVQFTPTGNPNNYLSDISVEGLSLSPSFTGSNTNYTLTVDNAINSINVGATAVASTSTVTGTGVYNLAVGANTVKIMCVSQSGNERIYTLTIVREGTPDVPDEPGSDLPDSGDTGTENPGNSEDNPNNEPTEPVIPPSISSATYKIGQYITGIQPGTSVTDFLNGITRHGNAEVKLLDKNGAEKTGTVGTGNVLAVYGDGKLVASYEIVIYGDVNGDGEIKMSDLLSINRHVIGTIKLKDVYLEAGDVNRKGDGATMSDLLAINRHVIGTILIVQ